jgi:hypothetical protein
MTASFRFIPATQLNSFPKPQWLIEGQIPARGTIVVFGPSDSYKSFYMLALALKVSQQGEVIFVYPEGVFDVGERLEALLDWTGLNGSRLILCPDAVEGSNPTSVSRFIENVKQRYSKVKMVVLDTLAANFGEGDESTARDMGRYNRGINRIEQTFKCPVVSVHHSGRDGKDERGSSSLKGNADVMIRISRIDAGMKVQCTKMRPARKFPDEKWKLIPHLNSCVLEKQGELASRLLQILQALLRSDMRHGEIQRATAIPPSTVSRLLEKLKTDKYIGQVDECYHLLKKGRDAIAQHGVKVGPTSTAVSDETDDFTETGDTPHSMEQTAARANGNADNELTEELFHVPPINSDAMEHGTHSVPSTPPPYKGEVEQVEGNEQVS